MQVSPNPCDIYPPEILEWSAMLTEDPSERHQQAQAILCDDNVMYAAQPTIAAMLADNDHWQEEDRLGRLDGFWRFIEEAAALPEQQPPGSHLRRAGEVPVFSTPSELRRDISTTASTALELSDLLGRIATTITDTLSIEEAQRGIDWLDSLHSACAAKAALYSTKTHGVHDFPLPGSTAGPNAWGQWMLSNLDILAAIHLRGTYPALVLAVQRALINEATGRFSMPYEAGAQALHSARM